MNISQILPIPTSRVKELSALIRGAEPKVLLRYGWLLASHLPQILQARSLSPTYGAMPREDARFHFFGKEFVLGLDLLDGVREMYCRNVYNWLPSMRIRPDDVCVDLGANAGLFTLRAAKLGKRVVSVEAQSGFVSALKENLRKNGCLEKAHVLHALIGATEGVFASEDALKNASHFELQPGESTMDEVIELAGGEVNFLKMDIEGSEFALLRGEPTWLKHVQRIAMEVHRNFGDPNELRDIYERNGFHTLCTNSGLQILKTTEQIRRSADYIYASKEQPLTP